jgi:ribosomal protein S18 acetylase RimI-like enzyme
MAQKEGDIKIRRMVENDLPKINDIDHSLFEQGRATTWPFSFEAYFKGEVVGFLMGTIEEEERSRSIFSRVYRAGVPSRGRQIGWIDMIGISKDYWHMGIGRSLVEAFYKECQRNNAMVRISVRDNDKELKSFLVTLGFKKREITTYEKGS